MMTASGGRVVYAVNRPINPSVFLIAATLVFTAVGGALGTEAPVIPAFPGAEGAGAQTVGGRGGRVIEVTNLDDSGPGSLRAAVEATGSRIVVFRIGGTIRLQSPLKIKEPYITIAGQTATGGGKKTTQSVSESPFACIFEIVH